jgi:hypothetical protein
VFERVVEACIAAGLVGGEGFAVDASLIAADPNKQRSPQVSGIWSLNYSKASESRGAALKRNLCLRPRKSIHSIPCIN